MAMHLSLDPRGEAWAQDTSKFGFRMLQRMGWKQGSGLGANEDGITHQIKPSNKFDNAGIGLDPKSHLHAWESNTSTYASILAALNNKYSNPVTTTENEDDDKEAENKDEEKEKAKKKAKKDKKKKEKKDKKKQQKEEEEQTKSETATPEKPKVFRHLIYSRRLRSKDAANYGKENIAAILGHSAVPKPAPVPEVVMVEEKKEVVEEEEVLETLGVQTITSSVGINDYFKMRMAELDRQRDQPSVTETPQEEEDETATKKKSLQTSTETTTTPEPSKKRKRSADEDKKKKKKADKKLKKKQQKKEDKKAKRKLKKQKREGSP